MRNLQGEFVPYPAPKNYSSLLSKWIKKNPWVTVSPDVYFPLQTKILGTRTEIKTGTVINGPMTIKGSGSVCIGKYCGIAENLYIISSNHKTNYPDLGGAFSHSIDVNKGPVYIGNNVWIGDNVTVLSGVSIGDGAGIGAGSVVTRDVPPFAIAAGSPARVIRYRFSELLQQKLTALGWWHWSRSTILQHQNFFLDPLSEASVETLATRVEFSKEPEITAINFKSGDCFESLLDGWGAQEKDGRWMEQKNAGMIFKIAKPDDYGKIYFQGYSFYKPQSVSVIVNSRVHKPFKMNANSETYELKTSALKKGVNIIEIISEKGYVPSDIDEKSSDSRALFLRFISAKLSRH